MQYYNYYDEDDWWYVDNYIESNELGSYGTGDGQFDESSGVAVDNSGYVYVAESGNNHIQKFY